jgi:hypothetical protein
MFTQINPTKKEDEQITCASGVEIKTNTVNIWEEQAKS